MRHTNMGTVISGTMRAEDLIPAFISELRRQKPLCRAHRKLIRDIEASMKRMVSPAYFDSEQVQWDLDALFDALEAYAPAYFYFGAHPGDGSDYGFWLTDELDECFDGLKVNDRSEVPTGFSGEVLVVSDHGNLSLYAYSRGRAREVWAVV